jgi:acyl-CoA synthetase (NDP forming)
METFRAIVHGYKAFPAAPPLVSAVMSSVSDEGRQSMLEAGLPGMIFGLKVVAMALRHLRTWSVRVLEERPSVVFAAPALHAADLPALAPADRPQGERALLDWLASRGVPVTPGVQARDQDAAVRAAAKFGYPVVLKLAAPDVLHKSEVGGVKLNLGDETSVRAAFDEITASRVGGARIDGVIVSPMRRNELEMLVSVIRDSTWGPMLTLGLGGIWVEVLRDIVMVPLPVDRARVVAALETLKAAPLFKGARGRPRFEITRLADAIVAITQAAMAMGPELRALEINPLAISPVGAEAMDTLALWAN